MTTLTTHRFASRAALDAALGERLARALAVRSPSALMLSGGTTPLAAYRAIARQPPPHDAGLRIVFSDERYVPSDSEASNYHQARPLLDALALPETSITRPRTELTLTEAAADYERQLAALVRSGVPIGLGLLGLGADGHTASLFGAGDLERSRGHLAIAVQRPDGMAAVSVTPDFLARVAEPLFVVAASGKENAVRALLARDPQLTAWRAIEACPQAELWVHEADANGKD